MSHGNIDSGLVDIQFTSNVSPVLDISRLLIYAENAICMHLLSTHVLRNVTVYVTIVQCRMRIWAQLTGLPDCSKCMLAGLT